MERTARQHGTVACYGRGCRRPACRTAWATYIRDRRHGRGAQASRVDREIAQAEATLARIGEDEDIDLTVALTIPKDGRLVPVPLTPLGYQILAQMQKRTGARRGEAIDRLLREYGAEMTAA